LREVGDLLRRQLDDRDLPMIDKPQPRRYPPTWTVEEAQPRLERQASATNL